MTNPDKEPTVTVPLALLQVPPPTASNKVVDDPVQTVGDPIMAVGALETVIVLVATHPVAN